MAEITSALVKELREKTGAGMMDCKKALVETAGELDDAVDWLRKKGLAAAAKKSGRVAAEGLIAVACGGNKGAIVEVNAETDFVGKNDQFQEFARTTAEIAIGTQGDLEALKRKDYPDKGKTVEEELTHLIATIGENMSLRRSGFLDVSEGVVVSYIHNAVAPNLGRLGVLVALESSGPQDKLESLGRQLAMHVAATNPSSLNVDSLSREEIDRERDIIREQALASGKPPEFIDKMIEGRLRKFYEEVVFEEQAFVIDGKTKVKDVVAAASKDLGSPVKLVGFIRFGLGEGIEKEATDFASEVAEQLKS